MTCFGHKCSLPAEQGHVMTLAAQALAQSLGSPKTASIKPIQTSRSTAEVADLIYLRPIHMSCVKRKVTRKTKEQGTVLYPATMSQDMPDVDLEIVRNRWCDFAHRESILVKSETRQSLEGGQ